MSEKTAPATAPAALRSEDVTTPPPDYLERGTTAPTVVVQNEAPSIPTETEVSRGTSPPQEAAVEPTLVGETEQNHMVTSPPPTYPPMLPAEAPKTPGESTAGHVTALQYLTDQPTWIKCPYCNQRTKTQVTAEGSSAQCMSAALCCLCCGIITVCIPFLCHWFEDTIVQCSGCKKQVALVRHDGTTTVYWPDAAGQPPNGQRAGPAAARPPQPAKN